MSPGPDSGPRPQHGPRPDPRRPARPKTRNVARRSVDPARQAAWWVLRAVDEDDAYANLALPTYLWAQNYSALIRQVLVGHKKIAKVVFGPHFAATKGNVDRLRAQCAQRRQEVWCAGKK